MHQTTNYLCQRALRKWMNGVTGQGSE